MENSDVGLSIRIPKHPRWSPSPVDLSVQTALNSPSQLPPPSHSTAPSASSVASMSINSFINTSIANRSQSVNSLSSSSSSSSSSCGSMNVRHALSQYGGHLGGQLRNQLSDHSINGSNGLGSIGPLSGINGLAIGSIHGMNSLNSSNANFSLSSNASLASAHALLNGASPLNSIPSGRITICRILGFFFFFLNWYNFSR